ncbi:chemotaxis protein CheX [Sulfurospirillum arcachonense]|uniref:chemotaxis protein CheX n=1 Tax=Sulfurospirillum arcachonense TaxID=57666 RepID=UPI0004687D9E|nr:chemotaxis protein CheX [Sulfurospirillum arcachonense]
MKPVVKQKVAFFSPMGFLDGENAIDIINPADIDFLIQTKQEGAFISLKKVVFFNKKGITLLIESLQRVREKCGTIVGFCDYDSKKYKMILDMFPKNVNFSLFDTSEIVMLFVGDNLKNPKEKKIVVFSEKNEQKNQLTIELYERGFTPVIAKDMSDLLVKKQEAEFVIENSYLGKLDKTPTVYIKDNVIIYTLKGFVDSDIAKSFDMQYQINSLKIGFKLFLFDAEKVSSINVHGVNFISKLSTAGAEYGASIVITGLNNRKITQKLRNDLEDSGVLIYPSLKSLFDDEELLNEANKNSSVAKKSLGITKNLIAILPVTIQEVVKIIEVLSGYNTKKEYIKVQPLEISNKEDMLTVSIGFYGDIGGILLLLFDKNIVKEVCKILLEEDSTEADVIDALSEFIYIIGEKISQQLLKKSIKIDLTMPRTFDSVKDIIASQHDVRGAQVNLNVDGKNLTLFLTR